MVTKKDVLILGVASIGGLAIASMMSNEGNDFGEGSFTPGRQFFGGNDSTISPAAPYAPNVYNIPASPEVNFPAPPTFDLSRFLAPFSASASGGAATKKSVSGGSGITPSKSVLSPLTGVIAGLKQTTGSVTPSKSVLSPLTGVIAGLSNKKRINSSKGVKTSKAKRASNIASHAAGLSGAKKSLYLSASKAQAKARGE